MNNATLAWVHLLQKIVTTGDRVDPRGVETSELFANQTVINMQDPMVTFPLRKVSYPFMLAEAWWIAAGYNDVSSIKPYAPSIARFSDNGHVFNGAYGPAIISQYEYVIEALMNDECSRQAVLTIWNRNPGKSKDIPCTIALQFMIRNGAIHCVASMRSSDVWIGFIYDIFNFSVIAVYIAIELKRRTQLKLKLGKLSLTAGSQHLYASNRPDALKIIDLCRLPKCDYGTSPFKLQNIMDDCKSGGDLIERLEELKDFNYES